MSQPVKSEQNKGPFGEPIEINGDAQEAPATFSSGAVSGQEAATSPANGTAETTREGTNYSTL